LVITDSSILTLPRYTLRNAEYRLSLQRSLDLSDEEGATVDGLPLPALSVGTEDPLQGSVTSMELADTVEQMQFTAAGTSGFLEEGVREEELDSLDRLGPVSPEVAKYIQQLQSKLLSTQKVSGPFLSLQGSCQSWLFHSHLKQVTSMKHIETFFNQP
jgi:hypothetical protein